MKTVTGRIDVLCLGHKHLWRTWKGHLGVPIMAGSGKTTKRVRERGRKSLQVLEYELGASGPVLATLRVS